MKEKLIKILKSILSDVRKTAIGLIVVGLIGGTSGLLYLSKTALSFSIAILNTTTPLWATILLVLICCLYTYLKIRLYKDTYKSPEIIEKLYEAYGVNWNKEHNKRCLLCKKPLKYSSEHGGFSVFFCSDTKCNNKHVLRDKNGNFITEQQAIDFLKKDWKFLRAVHN